MGKPVGICSEELRCSQVLRVCDTIAGRKKKAEGWLLRLFGKCTLLPCA